MGTGIMRTYEVGVFFIGVPHIYADILVNDRLDVSGIYCTISVYDARSQISKFLRNDELKFVPALTSM